MEALALFGPDLPPSSPGVLLEVADLIPTSRGYKGRPSGVSAGAAALGEAANSLAVLTDLSGTRRTIAGASAAIYELIGGTWTDVSDTGGYDVGTARWTFAPFGNTILAAAKAETLQASTTGDFAAVSGAPKASWVDTSGGFVMLADTNDGIYGDQSDRWWCSAYLDYTDWTPAVSTQCATGRLVDSPGPILALKALGGGFVAYKERAIFLASYVGAPSVWQWVQIPGETGCMTGHGVVSIGAAHAFIGLDNIYLFDGARPVAIGGPVREWFFHDLNPAYAYRTIGTYDPLAGNVWWFYVSQANTTTTPDKALVFNVATGRFGVATLSVEAAARYYQAGVTYEGLGTSYSTYDDLPTDIAYDAPFWASSRPDPAYFDTSHVLRTLTGGAVPSSLLTGNFGDDDRFSTAQQVRPRFLVEPTTATCEHLYDDAYGDVFTAVGNPVSLYEHKFDVLWSSRWHRFRLAFTGDVELEGVSLRIAPDGEA